MPPKPLLAIVVAMIVSNAAAAQSTEAPPTTSKRDDRCKTYKFECAWKAEIEAQKANTQTSPEVPRQQASVTVKLEINEQGAADKCDIVSTDAPQKLADGVCPIFLSKAKFKPKVDGKGIAERQTLVQTVKFVIEN